MGLTGSKYLIKSIFDIKIEIGIFEISNVPNFNKSGAFLTLRTIWVLTGGKYLIKINFDIEIEISIFEISNVPNFNKF